MTVREKAFELALRLGQRTSVAIASLLDEKICNQIIQSRRHYCWTPADAWGKTQAEVCNLCLMNRAEDLTAGKLKRRRKAA